MYRTLLLLFFCSGSLFSQQNSWFLEAGTGVRTGWWMINYGSTDPDVFNNLSFDNSHLSATLPFDLAVGFNTGRWQFAIGGEYCLFFDDAMRRQLYNGFYIDRRYSISEGSFSMIHLFAQIGFDAVQKGKLDIGPLLRAGWFDLWSDHPQQYTFGNNKLFYQAGFDFRFEINDHSSIWLRPLIHRATIRPEVSTSESHRHHFQSSGINAGYRYSFQ